MCGRRAFVNQFAMLAFYQCEGVTSVAPVWLVLETDRKSSALTGGAFCCLDLRVRIWIALREVPTEVLQDVGCEPGRD